jgi:hypothetical protein
MTLSLFRVLLAFTVLTVSACGKKEKEVNIPTDNGTYFSIRQFAKDQLDAYWGQPFTLQKTQTVNGKTDSAYISTYNMDWASVLKTFFESDISDPKYLGKYRFSMFDDESTDSRNYYYEAIDKDLFTRSLQIITNPYNDMIKSIYIETSSNGRMGQRSQKLYYKPIKIIQIQEFESLALEKDKSSRVEYRFMY